MRMTRIRDWVGTGHGLSVYWLRKTIGLRHALLFLVSRCGGQRKSVSRPRPFPQSPWTAKSQQFFRFRTLYFGRNTLDWNWWCWLSGVQLKEGQRIVHHIYQRQVEDLVPHWMIVVNQVAESSAIFLIPFYGHCLQMAHARLTLLFFAYMEYHNGFWMQGRGFRAFLLSSSPPLLTFDSLWRYSEWIQAV